MADVTPKAEQTPYLEDDSAQPDLTFPILQPKSMAVSQSPVPTPPSKEVISTLYEQRQKCELRRLLKHTCPELKGLGNMVEEEFADILNSGTATDITYQGEVQSRRWIFENGTVENTEDSQKQTQLIEKSIQGEHAFEQLMDCFKEEGSMHGSKEQTAQQEIDETPQEDEESLIQEENVRGNVKAKRKMFEVCVTTRPCMENSTACFTSSNSLERMATTMKALVTSSTRNAGRASRTSPSSYKPNRFQVRARRSSEGALKSKSAND